MSEIDTRHEESYDSARAPERDDTPTSTDSFTVSVEGEGVKMTRTVDQATALNVIATVLGGGVVPGVSTIATAQPAPHLSSAPRDAVRVVETGDTPDIDTRITVGEYIDECEAKQFSAKITAIGHFLETRLEQPSFTREEVKSQFRQAGETQPANYSRDFNEAIAQRWIAEDPAEKGQFFVTKTGKAAIEAKFDRTTRRATGTRRKRSTSRTDNNGSSSPETSELLDLDE